MKTATLALGAAAKTAEPKEIIPQKYIDVCHDRAYTAAGLENGSECWCGHPEDIITVGAKIVPLFQCNMGCDGDGSDNRGGPWRLAVYFLKRNKKPQECPPPPPCKCKKPKHCGKKDHTKHHHHGDDDDHHHHGHGGHGGDHNSNPPPSGPPASGGY
ncbi:WSC domain-containing protein [Hirsutella rhossiliensis]